MIESSTNKTKKTILILRHGKSDWNADYGTDHERPLAARGRKASRRIGVFLESAGLIPDLVLTSTAVRARETLRLASEACGWTCAVKETRELYLAGEQKILEIIRRQPDSVSRLMLVGHNPTWENLVRHLIGGGVIRMPTAALAGIRMPVGRWKDIRTGAGVLEFLITPKLLKNRSDRSGQK